MDPNDGEIDRDNWNRFEKWLISRNDEHIWRPDGLFASLLEGNKAEDVSLPSRNTAQRRYPRFGKYPTLKEMGANLPPTPDTTPNTTPNPTPPVPRNIYTLTAPTASHTPGSTLKPRLSPAVDEYKSVDSNSSSASSSVYMTNASGSIALSPMTTCTSIANEVSLSFHNSKSESILFDIESLDLPSTPESEWEMERPRKRPAEPATGSERKREAPRRRSPEPATGFEHKMKRRRKCPPGTAEETVHSPFTSRSRTETRGTDHSTLTPTPLTAAEITTLRSILALPQFQHLQPAAGLPSSCSSKHDLYEPAPPSDLVSGQLHRGFMNEPRPRVYKPIYIADDLPRDTRYPESQGEHGKARVQIPQESKWTGAGSEDDSENEESNDEEADSDRYGNNDDEHTVPLEFFDALNRVDGLLENRLSSQSSPDSATLGGSSGSCSLTPASSITSHSDGRIVSPGQLQTGIPRGSKSQNQPGIGVDQCEPNQESPKLPLRLVCWHAAVGIPCKGQTGRSTEVRRLLADHSYNGKSDNHHKLPPACQRCGILFMDQASADEHLKLLQSYAPCSIYDTDEQLNTANRVPNRTGISEARQKEIQTALTKFKKNTIPDCCERTFFESWVEGNVDIYIGKSDCTRSRARLELSKWLVVFLTLFPHEEVPPNPFMDRSKSGAKYDRVLELCRRDLIRGSDNEDLPSLNEESLSKIQEIFRNAMGIAALEVLQEDYERQRRFRRRRPENEAPSTQPSSTPVTPSIPPSDVSQDQGQPEIAPISQSIPGMSMGPPSIMSLEQARNIAPMGPLDVSGATNSNSAPENMSQPEMEPTYDFSSDTNFSTTELLDIFSQDNNTGNGSISTC